MTITEKIEEVREELDQIVDRLDRLAFVAECLERGDAETALRVVRAPE